MQATIEVLRPRVYDELHRLAHRQLRQEPQGHTLCTTALVHEAFIKLMNQKHVQWHGHAHFMAIAATSMRRILVDHARRHQCHKRGGAWRRVPLDDVELTADQRADTLIALDGALDRLKQIDARQASVVECRFFGGMTEEETAAALRISVRTAKRDWAKAKSWLYEQVHAELNP